ncbi:MAG: hypothetical protein ACI8TX_003078, partial [Hyphomicrobiaceae bacterium]
MLNSMLDRRRTAIAVVVGLFSFLVIAAPSRAASTSEDFPACHKLYAKTVDKLAKVRSKTMLKCATLLSKCEITAALDGKDLASCNGKIVTKCDKKLDKFGVKWAKLIDKLETKKDCDPLLPADSADTVGLGYSLLESACAPLGIPTPVDFDTSHACLEAAVACHTDDFAEAMVPRLRSLLDSSGLAIARPGEFGCVSDPGVAPIVGGESKPLLVCQKKLTKSLAKPLSKFGKELTDCRTEALACVVLEDRLDADTGSTPGCLAALADGECDTVQAELVASMTAAITKASDGCADFAIGDLAAGLGFDAACGTVADATALATCVADAATLATANAIGDVSPRACEMRTTYGVLDDAAFAGLCVP